MSNTNTKSLKAFIGLLRPGLFVGILLMTLMSGRLSFAFPIPTCTEVPQPCGADGQACCVSTLPVGLNPACTPYCNVGYTCNSGQCVSSVVPTCTEVGEPCGGAGEACCVSHSIIGLHPACSPYCDIGNTCTNGHCSSIFADPEADNACNVEMLVYKDCFQDSPLGIALTGCDIGSSIVNLAYSRTTSSSINETVGCSHVISELTQMDFPGSEECNTTDEAVCEQLLNRYSGGGIKGCTTGASGSSRIAENLPSSKGELQGSLLGAVYSLENTNYSQPEPANLAYYFNRQMAKLPFVGETYAQAPDYGAPLVSRVFGVWQVFRNLAYALMAVVMMVIGIFIILRKKVDQRIVVSAQYALPRVIIALVLITFSYPIGALFASLGWSLWRSGPDLVQGMFGGFLCQLGSSTEITHGIVVITMFIMGLFFLGAGAGALVILVIVFLIMVVMLGLLWFKAISIYLKMALSIITAPMEFCLGAIPGNESKTMEWFTRMFKYVVTLLFMSIIVPLVLLIALKILNPNLVSGTSFGTGLGALLNSVIGIFVVIYGFGIGISMENRVGEFLSGKKRR